MFRAKIFGLAGWLVIAVWAISACGPAQAPPGGADEPVPVEGYGAEVMELEPVPLGAGDKLRVIATTNIVAHIVSQVGSDAIELSQLLPIGTDPHTYIVTPQDVAAVASTHVIFANGANLESDFLPQLIQDTDAAVVYVSQGVEFREFGEGEAHEHEGEEERRHHAGIDPHTWTTPVNVAVFVHNIERTLSVLDPANAETYKANAEAYEAMLEALDEWIQAQIATIPADNRQLVTDHESFGYYADRYGLEQIGAVIPAFSAAAQPSARELAALEDAIHKHGIRAIFVGTTVNPSLAQQAASDTGIQLVPLYTGSLGSEGSGVETYVDYICYNTTAIVEALGGTPDVTGSPCQD